MYFTVVASIKDVERLIRLRGDEEEVEVRVSHTIRGVSQALKMRELLHRQMRRRTWCVGGIPNLAPLVAVAREIRHAQRVVRALDDLSTRAAKGAVAVAAELQAAAVGEAEKLSNIAYLLTQSRIVRVRLLGHELMELANDVRYSTLPAIAFRGRIRRALYYCGDIYNQDISVLS